MLLEKCKEGFIPLSKENIEKYSNLKYKELVKIFGYNENIIRKYMKYYGFHKNILKPKIPLTEEMLYEYYINRNTPIEKMGDVFGVSMGLITNKLKEFNIKKPRMLKNAIREETCLKKYGVAFASRSDIVKKKMEETCLKKYGNGTYMGSNDSKIKREKKLFERYGVINPSQKHIDNDILKIMNDGKKLKKFMVDNHITSGEQLAKETGYNVSGVCRKLHKYHLKDICEYSQSLQEREIRDYINQYYRTQNNIRLFNNKEIDIYIPELNLGIEFNGDFWHSEKKVSKNYHQEKSLLAEQNGIFIYHIFEYEWNTKKEQIMNQLNNLLGINRHKIGARKCIIKEVPIAESRQFLNENHLQGEDKSKVKLGLYYEDKLVSIMTFCKPRFNKNYEWELSRFCSLANYNIIGGASRLFNHFVKVYKPKNVISYSNIAHTRGMIYKTIGFKQIGISEPNYVWCKFNSLLSRYQCQKHKLLKMGYTGETEDDIMHNLKYYKIYDCGNRIWVY